ncbi:MAG: lipoate--protein ligase family protein [Planctomycetota bacterium]|nr:lipoate--protein ligase family protein [Planctomycetota bacterium]
MMVERWRFIETPPLDGAFNMALDESLMSLVVLPVLRCYRWFPPALSLGYFQETVSVDMESYRAQGYTIVRRPTGGGAICHKDELTFAVVTPVSHQIARSTVTAYQTIHGIIIAALEKVGVKAFVRGDSAEDPPERFLCFERTISCDIVCEGRKLVGSAQRRTKRGFLQHGSIPLEMNPLVPASGFVNLTAPRKVTYEDLKEAIFLAFTEKMGIIFEASQPTDDELALAKKLIAEKYANTEWTYRR